MPEHEASQLKQALDALTKMRVRLEAAERTKTEPIAIVGIGCRFPGGADDADSFWSLVMERRDAVTEVPADRWDVGALYDPDPLAAGKTSSRWGAFLTGIDRFDAAFFGISPREAARMDPQQRLLLEVAWSALEDAGLSPAGLAGQGAGVFVGVHSHSADYWGLQAHDRGGLDPYAGTGTSHSVLAGRLSYLLDLHGPSLAVDTACSSSLVAVHLACQALRSGECGLALAAGVNVILTPEFTVAASRMQMLAADGRCKTFDARADGFVRGEGCGVVVLKRLADALAAGDSIRAIIRGSAVNQDGRTNGLTAPSGPAQSALIRSVLAAAGLTGREIGYVEAHGTGTPLGDPIEVEALSAALGGRGADERCYLGSVKANVGHLEGAAGIAGLIKATLAVQRGTIPPQAQFERLNPHISLEGTGLAISTEPRAWPAGSSPRRAGVSSFGWSGTNAHVVVEQAPPASAVTAAQPEPRLLLVSGRSREALQEVVRRYRNFLPVSPAALDDIAYTAALRRAHHPHRAAVVARTGGEAADALRTVVDAGLPASPTGAPRVVFVFPGQGSQWLGMGRGLLKSSPAFRRAVEACDQTLREHVTWSLLDQLAADEATSRLGEIDVVQPVLWAIQVALAAHWRAWGIEPAAVVGHSMGEIAAAHVAGALTLSDAASVICRRSRLMKTVSGRGRMALVELGRPEAERALRGHEAELSVAVLNSPRSTVISGDPAAVETVLARLRAEGVFCREVSVDVASHSPQVDALLPALREELQHLAPRGETIPMISTVTGRAVTGSALNRDYWARNLREPVLFGAAVEALIQTGHTAFLEISPHPVLTPAVEDTLASLATAGTVVGSLRRHEDEPAAMLESLGALWVAGCSVAWDRLFPVRRVPVALPAYPWQRERYWIERVGAVGERSARRAGAPDDHPLLGRRLDLAHDTERAVWETELDGDTLGEPLEHRVGGVRMLAAAAVVAMMATAGRAAAGGPRSLTSVELRQPIALPEAGSRRRVQTVVAGLAAGARVTVYSRGDETGWTLHAEARLSEAGSGRPSWTEPARGTATARAARESGENAYEALRRLEVEIADRLRVIRSVQPDATMIGATIDGNGAFATTDDATRLAQALDAAFQLPTLGSVLGGSRTVSMPMRLAECRLHDAAGPAVAAHATKSETAPEGGVWNLQLLDGGGSLVAELVGLRMKDMAAAGGGELHEIQWIATAPVAQGLASARGRWIVLGDSAGVASVLSKHLAAVGGRMIAIGTGAGWEGELREQIEESDCRGVIVLSGLDSIAGAAIRESLDLCRTALGVVRAMLATHQVDPPRLWLVTRGAQAVPPDGASRPLAQSLWGFGRVIAEEHPEMWGGLIDLDPTATREADGRNLVAALADSRESEVAFRGGRLLAPRLRRVAPTPVEGPRLRPDASYVITGGLGALGLHVARWMAAHGAQDLVLLSRTPLPPREAWSALTGSSAARVSAVAEIEALGVRVHHGAVDVADMDALRGFLDRHRAAGLPTVRGVVHTAAVIDDRRLDTIDAESLDRVWHPKAQGAWHLHQIFEHEPLDFFVLFSSLGSVLGQTGQGSYAAANGFLDGLAHLRAAKGLPTVSVNWAGWAELGFAGTPGGRQVLEDLRVHGIAPLDPARALDLLAQALSGSRPQVVAVSIAREKTSEGGLRQSRLLAELRGDEPASARDRDAALARELVSLSAEDRSVRLERLLCESLGRVLKVAPDRVDRRKPLGSIGVDSLIALEFRRRLEAALGLALPATMVWNYPTVVELAGYLASRLAGARQVSPPPIAPAAPTANPSSVERVDELTDEEAARALLAARRPSHGG